MVAGVAVEAGEVPARRVAGEGLPGVVGQQPHLRLEGGDGPGGHLAGQGDFRDFRVRGVEAVQLPRPVRPPVAEPPAGERGRAAVGEERQCAVGGVAPVPGLALQERAQLERRQRRVAGREHVVRDHPALGLAAHVAGRAELGLDHRVAEVAHPGLLLPLRVERPPRDRAARFRLVLRLPRLAEPVAGGAGDPLARLEAAGRVRGGGRQRRAGVLVHGVARQAGRGLRHVVIEDAGHPPAEPPRQHAGGAGVRVVARPRPSLVEQHELVRPVSLGERGLPRLGRVPGVVAHAAFGDAGRGVRGAGRAERVGGPGRPERGGPWPRASNAGRRRRREGPPGPARASRSLSSACLRRGGQ